MIGAAQSNMVQSFPHEPGSNCSVASWSGMIKYQGFKYDQVDVFGIGCGFSFNYSAIASQKQFNMPITSDTIAIDFLSNIGIRGETVTLRNNNEALDQIIHCIDRGFPVAVKINPLFSSNLYSRTVPKYRRYLSQHWIVIIGYDLGKDHLYFFDSAKLSMTKMGIEDFKKGRNSGNFNQNPQNYFLSIQFPEEVLSRNLSYYLSLKKVVHRFLYVEKYSNLSIYTGSYGYQKAIRHISIWNKMLSEEKLSETIAALKITLTVSGMARGAYRFNFSEYLNRCAAAFELEVLSQIANQFRFSGSLWQEFIEFLDEVAKNPANDSFWGSDSILSKKLKELYELELKAVQDLELTLSKLSVSELIEA